MGLKNYIRAAKQGDEQAFKYLLEKYWNDIYRFQLSQINNTNDAEDITIETFAKAFEKIHTFDESRNFKNWLLAISKNTYLDLKRKKNTRTRMLNLSQGIPPNLMREILDIPDNFPLEDEEVHRQREEIVHRALARLKPAYRQMLRYRYFDGLSYKQIADISGENISNVKVRLMRAKKLFADTYKKIADAEDR